MGRGGGGVEYHTRRAFPLPLPPPWADEWYSPRADKENVRPRPGQCGAENHQENVFVFNQKRIMATNGMYPGSPPGKGALCPVHCGEEGEGIFL